MTEEVDWLFVESDDEFRWLLEMERQGKLNKRGKENLEFARRIRGSSHAD